MNKRISKLVLTLMAFIILGVCSDMASGGDFPPPIPTYTVTIYVTSGSCGMEIIVEATGWKSTSPYYFEPSITTPSGATLVDEDYDNAGKKTSTYQFTKPGTYSVTATGGGDSDSESFTINAEEGETEATFECDDSCPKICVEIEDDDNISNEEYCEAIPVEFNRSVLKFTGLDSNDAIPMGDSATAGLARSPESMSPLELASRVTLSDGRVIRIKKLGDDPDGLDKAGPMAPKNIGNWPQPGGEGCTSCSGGSGSAARSFKYHAMGVKVASKEGNTLANRSRVKVASGSIEAEINMGGDWFPAHKRTDWSIAAHTDTIDSQTANGFKVTDKDGNEYYYYEIGTLAVDDTPKLRRVKWKKDATTFDTVTYEYDSYGRLTSQEQTIGTDDYCIVYFYDSTTGTNGNFGLNQLQFKKNSSEVRSVTMSYADDYYGKLEEVDCPSCNGSQVNYSYEGSDQLRYDPDYNSGQNVSAYQFVTAIKDSSGSTVVSYQYDTKDRITEHYVGGNLVTEWIYTDDSNDNIDKAYRKDYIESGTGAQYRATVSDYTDGTVVSIWRYHDLQTTTGTSFTGDYSETAYAWGTDTRTETLPKDNAVVTTFDSTTGKISKKEKDDGSGTKVPLAEYTYYSTSDETDGRRLTSTNAYGGVTTYYYDSDGRQVCVKGATVTSGVDGQLPAATERCTEYDDLDRVLYEASKNANGNWFGTEYSYDSNGNLDAVYRGVEFSVSQSLFTTAASTVTVSKVSSPYMNAVMTDYTYNDFGELTTTAQKPWTGSAWGSAENVHEVCYSSNGVKLGEYDLSGSDVISAVKYTYGSEGRIVIRSILKADASVSESTILSDLAVSLGVDETTSQVSGWSSLSETWVHTVNVYSTEGFRTSVIADADQYSDSTSRSHLETEYSYNLQGEVIEVESPDGKIVRTTRDGRGLVTLVETGYYDGTTFETVTEVAKWYDDNGNLIQTEATHPDGDSSKAVKTEYQYDDFDRLDKTSVEEID